MAGISLQHCSGIETGEAKVSLPALVQLCRALDATLDEALYNSLTVVANPELMKEEDAIFSDASPDEMYLMLAQAKSIKEVELSNYSIRNC